MFYILSKIIGLLINPILWILTLLILGLFIKKTTTKHKLYLSAIITLLLFSNSFLFNEVMVKWEEKAVKTTELKTSYDVGIVLSGMVWYDTETKRLNFMQSSDRIWQAVRLYHEGRIDKILISGGSADIFGNDTIESVLLKNFLVKIGIPEAHVLTEEKSRNTRENAYYSAELLKNLPHNNLLLITSASHMLRALKCFEKVGLHCDIYPTDHYSGARKYNFDAMLIPSPRTLFNWNVFIHEMVGFAAYRVSGYI